MSDDLDALKDQYSAELVESAFALQEHIRQNGLDGVHFIEKARQKTQARKYQVTLRNLKENIPRRP